MERTHLSAAYFLFFLTIGLFNPYFPVYLRERGLSGVQIGWVFALAPLMKVFVRFVYTQATVYLLLSRIKASFVFGGLSG